MSEKQHARGNRRLVLICLFFLCWSAVLVGCGRKPETETVIGLGAAWFEVRADELGTAANGVVEICAKEKNALGIRILAELQIGPADFGGVAFSLPAGCRLEQVSCAWTDAKGTAGADPPVNVWTADSDREAFATAVEIARSHDKHPNGGGSGTVVLEASFPWNGSEPPAVLTFAAECGAEEKNGSAFMGVDCREIVVEIKPAVGNAY